MPATKRIVCLANSRRPYGRCIAGVEATAEGTVSWIRPVSARERREVSEEERQYQDGSDPKLLDVIDIPLLRHKPDGYQIENWLLDPKRYWTKTGVIGWRSLKRYAEPPGPPQKGEKDSVLWRNGCSSRTGINDRIPVAKAAGESNSLKLIHVGSLELHVFSSSSTFRNSKRRVQGKFEFSGRQYALWVTDPDIERRFKRQADGIHQLGECYLTISLGEPYYGYCYKLIAAVLEKP